MSGNNFDFHSFSTSVRQPCRRRPRSPRRISAWLARRRSFNGNNNFSPAFRACVNNRNGTRNLPDAMTSQSAHSRPRTPPHSTTVTHLAPSTVPTIHHHTETEHLSNTFRWRQFKKKKIDARSDPPRATSQGGALQRSAKKNKKKKQMLTDVKIIITEQFRF